MLELWCLLFVCLITGRRIADRLPNVMSRTIGLYVAPILGLAFLVLFATLYGWLSPFKWRYSLSLTAILVLVSIVFEQRKRELLRHGFYVGLFALICSLPVLAPIIRYSGYNPFTDIFTYLAQSQWLQDHAFAEKVVTSGFHPSFTQIALYQESGSRMGGTFFLGYVQSLFALKWSYDAYMPTVALGFVTGCLAIGGIVRQIMPVRKYVVLGLALLPSFLMNGFVYGAEWGFFPQTFGLAFAIGVCALFPYLTTLMMRRAYPWLQAVGFILPLSICTAALLFAYNEPFPIFATAFALFLLITLGTAAGNSHALLRFTAIYVVEVLILINYEAIRIVKNVYQTLAISGGGADIGWPVLWSPMQLIAFAFGMKSPFTHGMLSIDFFISTVVAPIVLVVMFVTLFKFMRAHPKRRSAMLFLCCVELILLIFICKFRYLSVSKSALEVGHTFLQFKIAKYAAPFSIALLASFIAILWHYFRDLRTRMLWVYGVIFVVGMAFHCLTVSKSFTNHFLASVQQRRAPFDVLLTLRQSVASIPSDDVIHVALGPDQSKLRQMIAYIFYDRKISSDYRDDGYIVGRLPVQDANMPITKADWLMVMRQPQDKPDGHNLLVGPFLIQKPPFHYVILGQQSGGYNTESDGKGNTWNWVKQSIDLPYHMAGQHRAIQFAFKIKSLHDMRTCHIRLTTKSGTLLANETLHLTSDEATFVSPWIPITGDQQVILHVEADGSPVRLSRLDSREARFMILNTTLRSQ